jgi:hypothetical protein
MNKIKTVVSKILFNKVDPIGLSIFRIAFSLVLLMEVLHLFKFRSLVYFGMSEFNPTLLFIFWIPVILMLIVGFKTKIAAIINYIFAVIVLSSLTKYEYHGYTIYLGLSFLILFLPLSKKISLDALLYATTNLSDNKVYKVFYFAPVFLVIALVYLDSVFFKLASNMWLNGLGMWLPASLPMATWSTFPALMNNELLVKFLGYLVLIFEALFILLIWFKRFRILLLIIGVFFHIGILFFFPIPWFALAVVGVYTLMVPIKCWLNLMSRLKLDQIKFNSIEKYKQIDNSLTIFSDKTIRRGWVLFFIISLSIQLLLTFRTPFMTNFFSNSLKNEASMSSKTFALANKVGYLSHKFLGMTNHGLFLDDHFIGYSQIIKVVAEIKGKKILVPLINDKGQPGSYIRGNFWTNYTFRVSGKHINIDSYLLNVYPYLVYFCNTNNLNIAAVNFELYLKAIEVPLKWEENYLSKMIDRRWSKIGIYSVQNEQLELKIE